MSIIASIYSVIQLILRLFGLWESFLDYSDNQRKIAAAKKQEELEKAVDASTKAEVDDEIWKSQNDITKNMP